MYFTFEVVEKRRESLVNNLCIRQEKNKRIKIIYSIEYILIFSTL